MNNANKLQSAITALAFAMIPPQALAQNHYHPVQQSAPQHTASPTYTAPSRTQSAPPPVHSAPPPPPRETPVHSAPPPAAPTHQNSAISAPAYAAPTHQNSSVPSATPMHTTTPERPATPMNSAPHTATPMNSAPHAGFAPSTPNRVASPNHFASAPVRVTVAARPARIETRRADGARVVVMHGGHGFVETRIAARPGFAARTYVVGGRSFVRVYREERFRGFAYHAYLPRLYFAPAFYGWAYDPWAAPIAFDWGWRTAPWYGYYGVYFRPAPVYRTPALWLTDFLIAENLKLAYEGQQQAAQPVQAASSDQQSLSPEVRELVAAEVRRQIEAEKQEANAGPMPTAAADSAPPALDPGSRVVVVSSELEVPAEDGTCRLTPGDILYRTGDSVGDDGQVSVTILSSKPGSCLPNSATSIDLATLQDMHNDFRAHIDAGLAVLAQNQGKGGLPGGPAAGARLSADGSAQVDTDAASALMAQERAANGRP